MTSFNAGIAKMFVVFGTLLCVPNVVAQTFNHSPGNGRDSVDITYEEYIIPQIEISRRGTTGSVAVNTCEMGYRVASIRLENFAGNPVTVFGARVQFDNGEVRSLNVAGEYSPEWRQDSEVTYFRRPRCIESIWVSANGHSGRSYLRFVGETVPNDWGN